MDKRTNSDTRSRKCSGSEACLFGFSGFDASAGTIMNTIKSLVLMLLLSPMLARRPYGKRVASVGDAALGLNGRRGDPAAVTFQCEPMRSV